MNGPEGRLEGRYQHGKLANAPIALMLHPHPQHGGTMNNKVDLYPLSRLRPAWLSVLRFNFRGVGRSQGRFDAAKASSATPRRRSTGCKSYNPNASQCWIAGFSFGAWIGMQLLMRRPEIKRLRLGGAAGQSL